MSMLVHGCFLNLIIVFRSERLHYIYRACMWLHFGLHFIFLSEDAWSCIMSSVPAVRNVIGRNDQLIRSVLLGASGEDRAGRGWLRRCWALRASRWGSRTAKVAIAWRPGLWRIHTTRTSWFFTKCFSHVQKTFCVTVSGCKVPFYSSPFLFEPAHCCFFHFVVDLVICVGLVWWWWSM